MTTEISSAIAPGPHGDVPVRVYRPAAPSGEGLVWCHGGGFVMGDLDIPEADRVSRELAACGITVVSVDYRLAVGGVLFPVPGDDVDAAWRWTLAQDDLGVDPGRWHLGGASAGGNLAAAQTQRSRDTGIGEPATALLIYPVLHDLLPEPSADLAERLAPLPDDMRFTNERCVELNLNYVGKPELLEHPYAFPAHGDVAGLAPHLIVTCDVDDLRPSGEAYAAQLALAGVDVALVREVGTNHGHLNFWDQPQAAVTVGRMADWILRGALASAPHHADRPGASAAPDVPAFHLENQGAAS